MKTLHLSIIICVCSILIVLNNNGGAFAQTSQYDFKIWPIDSWKPPGYWETIQGEICPPPKPDDNTIPSMKVYFGLPSWAAIEANTSQFARESSVIPSCDKPIDVATIRPNYTGYYPVYAVAQWIQNGKNQTVQSNSTQFFSQETCPVAYDVQTDGTKYYAGQTVSITVTNPFSDCHILPTNVSLKIFDATHDNLATNLLYQETRSIKEQAGFNFTLPKFPPQNNPYQYRIEISYNDGRTGNVTASTLVYSYNYIHNPPDWVQKTRFSQVIQMIQPAKVLGAYVTYGDSVKFFGYQVDPVQGQLGNPTLPPNLNYLPNGKPAIPGVLVNVRITGPLGNVVYDKSETTDNNGQFPEMTFSITKDLKRGLYEVYYNATKDGGIVFTEGGTYDVTDDYFVVGNETNFKTDWGGKSYQFSYYGVDTDASNFVFSQPDKSITFDIDKINGTFSQKNHIHTWGFEYNFLGYPIITLEKPLLTGPFTSVLNGKLISSSTTASNGSENGPELVGPVEENGKLTFTGTYVIPEFPFAIPVLLISILSITVFYRIRFRK